MKTETILIVDDDMDLLSLLKILLSPEYRVITSHNGQEGLAMAEKQPVDLIMLDLNMPRMNGMGMLVALREKGCNIPVIFMTAAGSEYVAVQAFRLGVYDYLAKPFSRSKIQQAINRALTEKRLTREKEALDHALVSAQAARYTVGTLAHHINNQLTVTEGGLSLLHEELQKLPSELRNSLLEIVEDCQISSRRITTVLRVLQQVATIELTSYYGDDQIIDIKEALHQELERLTNDGIIDR